MARRSLLLASFGVLAVLAGCGSSGAAVKAPPGGSSASVQTVASSPTLTVSPNTGLVGGQQLKVSITGFPEKATVSIYECAGPIEAANLRSCSGTPASTILYTSGGDKAFGTFIAQPGAADQKGTLTKCLDQCLLVGEVIKQGNRGTSPPIIMATASLSFSATAKPGLSDSTLEDLSWVSADEGWALASQPCVTGTCPRLARTTDGGAHWQQLPDLSELPQGGTIDCTSGPCVSHILFVSPKIGYLYGPALIMTTDGGHTWQAQPGPQVETLAIAGGNVYRVSYTQIGCSGPCNPSLQEAQVGSSSWHTVIGQIAYPDRSDSAQIVNSGSASLLAMYGSLAGPIAPTATLYHSDDSGGTWQQITDPCPGTVASKRAVLIDLTAAPGGFFAGLCSPYGNGGNFSIVSSNDGGVTWDMWGNAPATEWLGLISAASSTSIAISTNSGVLPSHLYVSNDKGKHWTLVATYAGQDPGRMSAWLRFETSQVGHWVGDQHDMWTTKDGGAHWTEEAFR